MFKTEDQFCNLFGHIVTFDTIIDLKPDLLAFAALLRLLRYAA
jgi:hypothetical protein